MSIKPLVDKIKENSVGTTQWHYGYDEHGNINYKVFYLNDELLDEVKVLNSYDEKNHLLSIKYKFLQYNSKVLFDGEFATYEYKYNKKGQLIKKIDKSHHRVFEYKYDDLGHLIKKVSNIYSTNPNKYMRHSSTIYYKYDKYGDLLEKSNEKGEVFFRQKFKKCR